MDKSLPKWEICQQYLSQTIGTIVLCFTAARGVFLKELESSDYEICLGTFAGSIKVTDYFSGENKLKIRVFKLTFAGAKF